MFGRNKKASDTQKAENCSNCGSSRTKDSASKSSKRSCSCKSSTKRSSK